MSERRKKLLEAADVIEDLNARELEAPNPKAKLTQASIDTIEKGVRDIAKQLPDEE